MDRFPVNLADEEAQAKRSPKAEAGTMRTADVTVENDHGTFRFYPQTERGRAWLAAYGARTGWNWEQSGLAIRSEATAQKAIVAGIDAGLEMRMYPCDSQRKRRTTEDGSTIH